MFKVSLHEEDLKEINYCVKNNLKIPRDVRKKIYKIVLFTIINMFYDREGRKKSYILK